MAEQHTDYLIVSDLHLNTGLNSETGRWPLVEDFFFDAEFAALLARTCEDHPRVNGRKVKLIINGDFAEFLQVLVWPTEAETVDGRSGWDLSQVGVEKPQVALQFERGDGLATSKHKSAWKLRKIYEGHKQVFRAIAEFIYAGHDVVLVKGNHDVEFYWPEVKREFVRALVDSLTSVATKRVVVDLEKWRKESFQGERQIWQDSGHLLFCESSYQDDVVYVEHGNQYENANRFDRFERPLHPTFREHKGRGEQFLDLPFGSIFVRYFFNKVEQHFPDADNIKPTVAALALTWRRSKTKTLWLAFIQGRKFLGALTYPPAWVRLWRTVKPAYVTAFLAMVVLIIYPFVQTVFAEGIGGLVQLSTLTEVVALVSDRFYAAGLILSVLWTLAGDFLKGVSAPYLRKAACERLKKLQGERSPVRFIVYGHTHDPDFWQIPGTDGVYCNTGTWTQVRSEEEWLTRPARQLTYLKVQWDGTEYRPSLLRWASEADEPEQFVQLLEDTQDVKKASLWFLLSTRLATLRSVGSTTVLKNVGRLFWNVALFAIGMPAVILWPFVCLLCHLLRPFWRLLKQIVRRRFSSIPYNFVRDLRTLGYWLTGSYAVLRSAILGWSHRL